MKSIFEGNSSDLQHFSKVVCIEETIKKMNEACYLKPGRKVSGS